MLTRHCCRNVDGLPAKRAGVDLMEAEQGAAAAAMASCHMMHELHPAVGKAGVACPGCCAKSCGCHPVCCKSHLQQTGSAAQGVAQQPAQAAPGSPRLRAPGYDTAQTQAAQDTLVAAAEISHTPWQPPRWLLAAAAATHGVGLAAPGASPAAAWGHGSAHGERVLHGMQAGGQLIQVRLAVPAAWQCL